jgi:hypothetical protein
MDEYEFSIISAWKNHKKKNFLVIQEEQPGLDLLLGEVARQAKQVRDFPSYLHLFNLESSGECNYNKYRVQCK